jgi:uncharacterized NAD-dependent epimerase/dehydratase family protein
MKTPYLLFLGDAVDIHYAKTASGIRDWRGEHCLGQFRLPGCPVDLGLPDMTPHDAAAGGAGTMILGIANDGGFIPEVWVSSIVAALEAGLDVAAGLHDRLVDVPEIQAAATRHGRKLYDVRHSSQSFPPGNGIKRAGKRLLTVGTDCAVGKKYAALAIERSMRGAGYHVDFRPTGQTGILIAGRGVAVDSVVADFIAGAAEWLSPANDPAHWDVIEGQGALCHPAYAGVTLALIHGSQPDALVVCDDPGRKTLSGLPAFLVGTIDNMIGLTEAAARLTNPAARVVGLALNTATFAPDAAKALLAEMTQKYGMPTFDPLRTGADALLPALAHFA